MAVHQAVTANPPFIKRGCVFLLNIVTEIKLWQPILLLSKEVAYLFLLNIVTEICLKKVVIKSSKFQKSPNQHQDERKQQNKHFQQEKKSIIQQCHTKSDAADQTVGEDHETTNKKSSTEEETVHIVL